MVNEHRAQEHRQELEPQRVEHQGLIRTVTVTRSGCNTYAIIDGQRHKVYPTGNSNEPWTTNIRFSSL